MPYTDDPVADFLAWDAEQNKQLEQLPKCADCDEVVQEDHYYLINDEVICQNCLDSNYRKNTDEFLI